ncbi:MAG: cysteine synthase A [Verrucomicrobiota bacterium]|nr:cysteine synthase A [Verrucomicrobiota bacterium]
MANIYPDNSQTIGKTPLVQMNRILGPEAKATILAKIEGRNPAYSVKCRIGAGMIWDAESKGLLGPGKEIVEPTSGNTGIALAFVSAARNYPITLCMPESMSLERRKVLAALGAHLVLTPAGEGMAGAVRRAEAIVAEDPDRYFMPQQFKNPANPEIHRTTTGPEIWEDTDGQVDVLVSGVGTGGTLTGIGRYFKEDRQATLLTVAVEPVTSPVISQTLRGEPLQPGPHKIQGIGAGFIPDVLDLSLIDRVETVSNEDAFDFARRLAREEGLLCGISCGESMAVAVRLAQDEEFSGKTIVVILPDAAERYLSSALFQDLE